MSNNLCSSQCIMHVSNTVKCLHKRGTNWVGILCDSDCACMCRTDRAAAWRTHTHTHTHTRESILRVATLCMRTYTRATSKCLWIDLQGDCIGNSCFMFTQTPVCISLKVWVCFFCSETLHGWDIRWLRFGALLLEPQGCFTPYFSYWSWNPQPLGFRKASTVHVLKT